jgi:hypothetical protein
MKLRNRLICWSVKADLIVIILVVFLMGILIGARFLAVAWVNSPAPLGKPGLPDDGMTMFWLPGRD